MRFLIIDAHAHLGVWSKEEFFPVATAYWLASYLDLMGFDKLIASSLLAIFYDFHEGNLAVVEATRRYKGRILGYVTVTTSRFLDEAIKEVEEMVTKYGMVGVKIYSTPLYHPVPMPWPEVYYLHIDEPWMYRIVEKAAELEVPVLAHATPEDCLNVAKAVPDATIIMAHMGNTQIARGDWNKAIMVAESCKNIILDTCSSTVDMGFVERAVERLGAERIVFGSDVPLFDPWCQLEKVKSAEIDEEDKRLILGENIARILRLEE
ncbi:MAG TPA: amidohydrolase [Candidatus Bathyarchaeota archaeon]|nr:amidohydrolase [Candidatus Bathyarchaeota archaeon]